MSQKMPLTRNIFRSLIYSLEGLGDRRGVLRFNTDVVLQISSPMRGLAYAQTVGNGLRKCLARFIIEHSVAHYHKIWYLTAPYSVRLKRHRHQVAAGENADSVARRFPNEEFFRRQDAILLKTLRDMNSKVTLFDTSVVSQKEIVSTIIADTLKKI